MILLERIKTKLSAAVSFKDELSPEKKVIGDVFLKVSGVKKLPVKHSTGYYLLMSLPEGKYNVIAGGKFYKEEVFTIDTKSLNQKLPLVDLSLKPNAAYPFPEGITILKGKILDAEDKPIAGAAIKIAEMTESAVSEKDGTFFIYFSAVDADKKITLNIKKDGFKPAKSAILLKKGITTFSEIKLAKK